MRHPIFKNSAAKGGLAMKLSFRIGNKTRFCTGINRRSIATVLIFTFMMSLIPVTKTEAYSELMSIGETNSYTSPELNTDSPYILPSIEEDNFDWSGFLVSELLSGKVTDRESTEFGIAVTYVDNTNGQWQYYNIHTEKWYSITEVQAANAFILFDNVRLRFVPAADWNGTAAIQYHTWDRTGGFDNLSRADINSAIGTSFSFNKEKAQITVTPVNDEPYITEVDGGNYLGFDGNADYVTIPDLGIYHRSFTVEGWVKYDAFNTWSRFFEVSRGPDNYNIICAVDANPWTGTSQMVFEAIPQAGPRVRDYVIRTAENFPRSQWVHVAVVYDEEQSKGFIYWNGVLKAEGFMELRGTEGITRTNNWLGRSAWFQDGGFAGGMRDVRFWSAAKGQTEIISQMNTVLSSAEVNLVANYKLDNPSDATTAVDASGNSQHGIISGASWRKSRGFISGLLSKDNEAVSIAFNVFDMDNLEDVTVKAISSNREIVKNESDYLYVTGEGTQWNVNMRPTAKDSGTSDITVIVSDGFVEKQYTFTLTVDINPVAIPDPVPEPDIIPEPTIEPTPELPPPAIPDSTPGPVPPQEPVPTEETNPVPAPNTTEPNKPAPTPLPVPAPTTGTKPAPAPAPAPEVKPVPPPTTETKPAPAQTPTVKPKPAPQTVPTTTKPLPVSTVTPKPTPTPAQKPTAAQPQPKPPVLEDKESINKIFDRNIKNEFSKLAADMNSKANYKPPEVGEASIAKGVKVFNSQAARDFARNIEKIDTQKDGSMRLVLTRIPKAIGKLKKGQVIFFEPDETNPMGFSGKISSKEQLSGGKTALVLSKPQLTELFSEVDISAKLNLNASNITEMNFPRAKNSFVIDGSNPEELYMSGNHLNLKALTDSTIAMFNHIEMSERYKQFLKRRGIDNVRGNIYSSIAIGIDGAEFFDIDGKEETESDRISLTGLLRFTNAHVETDIKIGKNKLLEKLNIKFSGNEDHIFKLSLGNPLKETVKNEKKALEFSLSDFSEEDINSLSLSDLKDIKLLDGAAGNILNKLSEVSLEGIDMDGRYVLGSISFEFGSMRLKVGKSSQKSIMLGLTYILSISLSGELSATAEFGYSYQSYFETQYMNQLVNGKRKIDYGYKKYGPDFPNLFDEEKEEVELTEEILKSKPVSEFFFNIDGGGSMEAGFYSTIGLVICGISPAGLDSSITTFSEARVRVNSMETASKPEINIYSTGDLTSKVVIRLIAEGLPIIKRTGYEYSVNLLHANLYEWTNDEEAVEEEKFKEITDFRLLEFKDKSASFEFGLPKKVESFKLEYSTDNGITWEICSSENELLKDKASFRVYDLEEGQKYLFRVVYSAEDELYISNVVQVEGQNQRYSAAVRNIIITITLLSLGIYFYRRRKGAID